MKGVAGMLLIIIVLLFSGCASEVSTLSGGSIPIGDIDGQVYRFQTATTAGRAANVITPATNVPVELVDARGLVLRVVRTGEDGAFHFPNAEMAGMEIRTRDTDTAGLAGRVALDTIWAEVPPTAQTGITASLFLGPQLPETLLELDWWSSVDLATGLNHGDNVIISALAQLSDATQWLLPACWAATGGIGEIGPDGIFTAGNPGVGHLIMQYQSLRQSIILNVNPTSE